jgi:hypothetical protein
LLEITRQIGYLPPIKSLKMKWTFIIQQKIKMIALLTSLIALIGITNYIEHQNIHEIDQSFNSIYYDRLVPATELLHMTQNLYKHRMLMESAILSTQPDLETLRKNLDNLSNNTEERIVNFEKTFMVKHESYALVTFKRGMYQYEIIENQIIDALQDGRTEEASEIYRDRLRTKFTETLGKLEDLSSIQTSVGKNILENSRSAISNSSLVLTLQIVTAIIIGLMTHGLIIASRMANVNVNNFHLN